MTIEFKIIIGLLLHLAGDYLFQNDWMAQNKVKSNIAALVHATVYSLPFLIVCSISAWYIIWFTHYFIDRFRLATYWIKFVNWNWQSENFGYSEDKPKWMSVWLMIIVDNSIHVIINTLSIIYL